MGERRGQAKRALQLAAGELARNNSPEQGCALAASAGKHIREHDAATLTSVVLKSNASGEKMKMKE
jgi:hypothetical protein